MYEISNNRAVPPSRGGGKSNFPFRKMREGDSFFVPGDAKMQRRLSAFCGAYSKQLDVRFVTRRIVENGIEGVAVFHCGARAEAAE